MKKGSCGGERAVNDLVRAGRCYTFGLDERTHAAEKRTNENGRKGKKSSPLCKQEKRKRLTLEVA